MTQSSISPKLAAELLGFLDNEALFLEGVEQCAAALNAHPVGQAFTNVLIKQLSAIQVETGARNQERATMQRKLAGELMKTPAAIRLSEIEAEDEISEKLQSRRLEVLKHAKSAEISLRTVLGQMTEANAVVTAVLDAVLGAPIDRSRYNSEGKPVSPLSHVKGQRVA